MLGQRIRHLRKTKSLTLQQVAQALGVTRACVSKWETGASQPDLTRLGALAEFFGLSTSELIRSHTEANSPAAAPPLNTTGPGLPVVSLAHGTPIHELISKSALRYPSPRPLSSKAFFVALGGYMVAHFGLSGVPREALLLVEPEAQPHSGDLVLAHSNTLGYQVLATREGGAKTEHVSLGIKLSHLGPVADATVIGVVLESVNTQDLRGFALRHSPELLFA